MPKTVVPQPTVTLADDGSLYIACDPVVFKTKAQQPALARAGDTQTVNVDPVR